MKKCNLMVRILNKLKREKWVEETPKKLTQEELVAYINASELGVLRDMLGKDSLERQDEINNMLWLTGEAG